MLYLARRVGGPVVALRDDAMHLGDDSVPPERAYPVREVREVSRALHEAGRRSHEAKLLLETRVREAVVDAESAQAKLLEGQKREAIGRLTGGLAHEFNNLLQTISVALQVLERDAREGRNAACCSRPGGHAARRRPGAPDAGLRPRAAAQARAGARSRGCCAGSQRTDRQGRRREDRSCTLDVPADLPPVYVDPAQLELAVLNLVFNARDAMPGGGADRHHRGAAPRPGRRADRRGRSSASSVRDNGAGMDEATKAKAFEPYFTTKPIGAGSGLGLAQVRRSCARARGMPRSTASPAAARRVALWLPVAAADAQAGDRRAGGGAGAARAAAAAS